MKPFFYTLCHLMLCCCLAMGQQQDSLDGGRIENSGKYVPAIPGASR